MSRTDTLTWPVRKTGHRPVLPFILLAAIVLLSCAPASAQSFSVHPTRVSFDRTTKAQKLIIRNKGATDLSLQVGAFKWSQNKDGRDVYEDTSDIVVFPPIFKIRKGEQRLVRLGTTLGPTSREGAYRVFVEELPVADPKRSGPGINLVFKVGIPLFVSPLQASREALGICLAIEEGTVVLSALNNDNAHAEIESVSIIGQDSREKEIFSKGFNGWYILSGSSRVYKVDIPPAICKRLASVHAVVRTARNSFEDVVEVTGGMCGPQTR
ncbi:MAG TPA: fimbria/pilus periplasmic chaperone [Syntrophorhabdaceae bacterium]|nr:fimbria/pilus periplasmic chaperone [Syntrophorhabdaceae bacterium]